MSHELLKTKRDDLQCWRALSIFAVLFFHIWPDSFPNGYLGVDIFFLLSGYLMASLYTFNKNIEDEMVDFYFRRIKRILPIYLVVIVFTVAILSQQMFPEEFNSIIEDSKWAIRLATNYEDLLKKRGYFEIKANFRFFRHCWSLAVEMQFYLIFPFLAMLNTLTSVSKYQLLLVVCISISFLYQIYSENPIIQYESLFCRIWQFSFGMLAQTLPGFSIKWGSNLLFIATAVTVFCPLPLSRIVVSFTTVCSVAAIITMSNVHFDPFKSLIHFPIPIYCLTFLGDISYILYLIHWPVITYFLFMSSQSVLSLFDGFLLFSISVTLAVVAHYSLEKPIIKICHNQRNLITVLFILYSINVYYISQYLSIKSEFSLPKEDAFINLTNEFYKNITKFEQKLIMPPKWSNQHDVYMATKFQGDLMGGIYECKEQHYVDLNGTILFYCELTGNPNATMTALIIGNSFAMNIIAAVSKNPLFSKTISVWGHGHNFPLNNDIERYLVNEQIKKFKPDVLFIVQCYFQKYLVETPVNQIYEHPEFKHWNKVFQDIENYTSAIIMNKEQIFFPYDITQDYIRRRIYNLTSQTQLKKPPKSVTMEKWLTSLNCTKCEFFDYRESFCDEEYCNIHDKVTGLPLFRDVNHISPIGLRYLKPFIDSAINKALKRNS